MASKAHGRLPKHREGRLARNTPLARVKLQHQKWYLSPSVGQIKFEMALEAICLQRAPVGTSYKKECSASYLKEYGALSEWFITLEFGDGKGLKDTGFWFIKIWFCEWGILTTFLGLQPDESFDKCFSSDSDISSSFTPPSPSLVPCGTQVQ